MVRYSTFDGCANTGARLLFLAASSAHFKREAGGSVVFVKNAQVYKKLSGVRLARIVFKESVCGLCGVSLSKVVGRNICKAIFGCCKPSAF